MKKQLCSIHDIKVKEFTNLIAFRTIEEAIRAFSTECKKEGSDFNTYSSDFSLQKVGEFDPKTGLIEACSPQLLAHASEYKDEN